MATKSVKKPQFKTNRGRIVGVIPNGGNWLFVVQTFSTTDEETPVVCGLVRAADLKGSVRKKAERWAAWLDMKGEAA